MMPAQAKQMAIDAMRRHGLNDCRALADRIPRGWTKDPALDGTIKVTAFPTCTTDPLDPIETALRTLPGIVKVRVIRGREDWIGRERDLRPQVIVWLEGGD